MEWYEVITLIIALPFIVKGLVLALLGIIALLGGIGVSILVAYDKLVKRFK